MGASRKKKELTFKKYPKGRKGGRWCKKINGKLRYFGTGSSKSDTKSYRAALAKYRKDMKREDQVDYFRQLGRALYHGKLEAELGQGGAGSAMKPEDIANGALDMWTGFDSPDGTDPDAGPTIDQVLALVDRQARISKSSTTSPSPGTVTINDHVDTWIKAEELRYQTGSLSMWAFKSKRLGIKAFRDFAGKKSFDADTQVEALLTQFRTFVLGKLQKSEYSANTVNDKFKFLRQFIAWAYQQRVLSELPRNLKQVTTRVSVTKSGQPLSLADVRKFWHHAEPKMRCWIALGLNCGFKNSDIAGLKAEHLEKGRLIGRRGKTNVPMNYKLWPVTRDLIERTRMDGDQDTGGLLFINAQGRPVVTDTGSDRVGHAFKKLAKRAGVDATFQQLRDTGAQAVQDISREEGQVNPALVQLYLAHKDGSTAAYYVSDDPHSMATKPLDDILDRLDEYFKLDADQADVERKTG